MKMVDAFGFEFRPELYYSKDHAWAKVEPDGNVRVGFDDIVAKASHEFFFMKVNSPGNKFLQGKKMGVIESRKYTGPIVAPVSGEIISLNAVVQKNGPTMIMADPYGDGYLAIIKPSNLEADLPKLMHGDAALEWFKKEAEPLVDELALYKEKHKNE
jgi:glycine cleavage system H protein